MQKALTGLVVLMWAAVLLGGAFRPQAPTAATGTPRPQVGSPAPSLTAYDWEGRPVALSDLKGKAVFLNFWASWCAPCRMEMPEIERLVQNLPEGTAVLAVSVDTTSPESVQAFLQEGGYTFPVVMDPHGRAEMTYQVLSLPTSFFMNPEGVITARINGPLSHRAMLDYLTAAAGR